MAFSRLELYASRLDLMPALKRDSRRGIGSTSASFAVVLLIVVGGIGVASTMKPAPKSPTETGSGSASVASIDGLRLTLSSNVSELAVGQHLNVSLSIVNTLPEVNTLKPSNDWLMHGVPVALWPACYFGLPAQVAVLQGDYSAQTIQAATNVAFNYICMESVTVDHVIFRPNSDQVNLTGLYDVDQTNQTLGPFNMSLSFTTGGYWNLLALSGETNIPIIGEGHPWDNPAYTSFTPGVYTIAVADEWGQIALLHIQVTSAAPQAAGLQIHVINETSGQPVSGVRVVAGPVSSPNDLALTPAGPTLNECVHQVPSGSTVIGNGSVVLPNGTTVTFPACPLTTYTSDSSGYVSIPEISGPYYYFDVTAGLELAYNVYGVVPLIAGEVTLVTVFWPNGNYTVSDAG